MSAIVLKFCSMLLLIAIMVTLNGCMTCSTLDSAKSKTHHDQKGEVIVDQQGHPAKYVLLLVAVPADVVTSPFQAMFVGLIAMSMAGYQGS
jgi:uncharacterized protein YceK